MLAFLANCARNVTDLKQVSLYRCPAQISVREENFLNRFNLGVRFLGFAGVLGIQPIVEGVQERRESAGAVWVAGRACFLPHNFHQPRVLFPSPKDFNFLFARQFLA